MVIFPIGSLQGLLVKLYSPGETSACRFKAIVKVSKYAQIEVCFIELDMSTYNQINVDP